MSVDNIVRASFVFGKTAKTRSLHQWDYGQVLRFEGIDLPASYTVHFANQPMSGNAKTQVGGPDGVSILDEYLTTGLPVYAWVFLHAGADDGETVYMVTIPVTKRPKPTEDEPTPVQQGAIDQAIAALNEGVDRAEAAAEAAEQAVEGVQDSIDAALQEAKNSGEFDGADGVSPTATVTQTSTGATITVTDAQGTTTAEISNGQDGEPGTPGAPGTDGFSPTITVTDITGGHRVTITDADGPHSFDVMNGEDGQGAVQDVQVNGVSVLQDGVANVPIASATKPGVIKVASSWGLRLANGEVVVNPATAGDIKAGQNNYKPLISLRQHESTFYGLAKAAGDTTQSASSNAVGTYTDDAKIAIQKMLGVNRAFELISEFTVDVDRPATNPLIINTDISGNSFELDAASVFISVPQSSSAAMNGYFTVYKGGVSAYVGLRFNNFAHASYEMLNLISFSLLRYGTITAELKSQINSANTIYTGLVKWTPDAVTAEYIHEFCIRDNIIPAGTTIQIWGHRI